MILDATLMRYWHVRFSIDFIEVMEMLDKRLNDKGKNWRHVFKVCITTLIWGMMISELTPIVSHAQALTVLEYLLLYGSENVFKYCEDNLYEFKTLREFQYIDDNEIDQGINVRQIAKDIVNLVLNPQQLKQRRRKTGSNDYDPYRSSIDSSRRSDEERRSSESRPKPKKPSQEEQDLQRAIELSKEEEERRKAAVARANSTVFNDLEGYVLYCSVSEGA